MGFFLLLAGTSLLFWGIWRIQRENKDEVREAAGVVDELILAGQQLLDEIDRRKKELDGIKVGKGEETAFPTLSQREAPPEKQFSLQGTPRNERMAQVRPTNSFREKVWVLADEGLDSADIAKRLGSSKGEVELCLRLRQVNGR